MGIKMYGGMYVDISFEKRRHNVMTWCHPINTSNFALWQCKQLKLFLDAVRKTFGRGS